MIWGLLTHGFVKTRTVNIKDPRTTKKRLMSKSERLAPS
jgi:hypothetical protein